MVAIRAYELLDCPEQPFVERRVAELIADGEMALKKLGGERVLQGASRRDGPEHEHKGQGTRAARRPPPRVS